MITNTGDVPLGLAVWLVHDEYDYQKDENYISATSLMKPIRQIVLTPRVPKEQTETDLQDLIASSLGTALHDSIEKAWLGGHKKALEKLGYPSHVIERVLVNPTDEELKTVKHPIPVYLEQRMKRKFQGFTIGGKYDMVAEGIVHDNKSTSAYTWLKGTKDDDYRLQGSLYRWLNPDKITEDFIRVNFIFTDWQKAQANQNPAYPQSRLQHKDIPLLSLEDTEKWIKAKLREITRFKEADQSDIPECTAEELWMTDPQYKYYANPAKTDGRSTKNFSDPVEARNFMIEKGGKGVIITIPGEAKRCAYCPAAPICEQRMKLHP